MINPHIALIAIAGTISTIHLYKENRQLSQEKAAIATALYETCRLMMYFGDVIDRNEVPITEFDRIVLNSFVETQKERP